MPPGALPQSGGPVSGHRRLSARLSQLVHEIAALENELGTLLEQEERQVLFRIRGKRIEFERSARDAHRRLRKRLLEWLGESDPRAVLSAPFVYAMAVPFVLMDVSLALYQTVCFRLWRIPRVRRSDYIVIDRHRLAYLNGIEKLNCVYCGYANGLIAYLREIAARSEQYWCPIKHARSAPGPHPRYAGFIAYGDAADYHARLEEYRRALTEEPPEPGSRPS